MRESSKNGDAPRYKNSEEEVVNGQRESDENALWLRFAEATDLKTFCQSWLSLQCNMINDVRSAMLLLGRGPLKFIRE